MRKLTKELGARAREQRSYDGDEFGLSRELDGYSREEKGDEHGSGPRPKGERKASRAYSSYLPSCWMC